MASENDPTAPHVPVQQVSLENPASPPVRVLPPRRSPGWWLPSAVVGLALGLAISAYLLLPARTNILLLGIDRRPGETNASRTDTMILTTVQPSKPNVGMLSIPRDLWVTLPNGDQNRINTAHFLAEAEAPGSGLEAAKRVVAENFGVTVDYAVRVDFDGLRRFVDALGGVEIDLPQAMSGYSAGQHVLNGRQALAFVRDRAGSDDFARMARGQFFLEAVLKGLASPAALPHWPAAASALAGSLDGDVPFWLWPRLAFALARVGPSGIDGRVISREMTTGFTTAGGAQVLAPDWQRINPVLRDMFDQ
jgi:LCP family protein required for cell wall assembly